MQDRFGHQQLTDSVAHHAPRTKIRDGAPASLTPQPLAAAPWPFSGQINLGTVDLVRRADSKGGRPVGLARTGQPAGALSAASPARTRPALIHPDRRKHQQHPGHDDQERDRIAKLVGITDPEHDEVARQ